MKTKGLIVLFSLFSIILSSCGPKKLTFAIMGWPDPMGYGTGCPPVFNIRVTGPGDGLRIDSIIAGYNLFDGSGRKVRVGTVTLQPADGAPPVWYEGMLTLKIAAAGTSASSPDAIALDFGEGKLDFAATVAATYLSPSPTGSASTFFFTDTVSVPVVPCVLTPTAGTPIPMLMTIVPPHIGIGDTTLTAPGSLKNPSKPGGGGPPSCSVDPNNPSCVP